MTNETDDTTEPPSDPTDDQLYSVYLGACCSPQHTRVVLNAPHKEDEDGTPFALPSQLVAVALGTYHRRARMQPLSRQALIAAVETMCAEEPPTEGATHVDVVVQLDGKPIGKVTLARSST